MTLNWEFRDVIAVVTLVCGAYLRSAGVDHFVGTMMMMVVAFYFGHGIYERHRKLE